MRTIIALLLASCAVSLAQTNTDASGYVTNAALLKPFTLTNSVGMVYTDAVLVKITANKFIYKAGKGAMGMKRLDSLPPGLLARIGYDPDKAAAADLKEAQERERSQAAAAEAARAAAATPPPASDYTDGVPTDVYQSILRHAAEEYPDDYLVQKFDVDHEVEAWKQLHGQ